MPTCTPQVVSPCADDAVSVGQVLGTRGDVAYDETGSVALTAGQTSAEITFGYQKESSDFRFEYLYVKTLDDNPGDVRAVPNSQTQRGFTVAFTGQPITANSTLYWRVIVPDALHTCQGIDGTPQYAIIRPTQEGIESFPEDQDFIVVTFPIEEDDDEYNFLALSIENTVTETPQVFPNPTVTSRTTVGFRIDFASSPDEAGYTLRWKIG